MQGSTWSPRVEKVLESEGPAPRFLLFSSHVSRSVYLSQTNSAQLQLLRFLCHVYGSRRAGVEDRTEIPQGQKYHISPATPGSLSHSHAKEGDSIPHPKTELDLHAHCCLVTEPHPGALRTKPNCGNKLGGKWLWAESLRFRQCLCPNEATRDPSMTRTRCHERNCAHGTPRTWCHT